MYREAGTALLRAAQGDLTAMAVDVVVNAANEQLAHGGGVAAALASAGGPIVQQESNEWVRTKGEVTPVMAAVTSAGAMPARWIVHVVGPRYHPAQDNEEMLTETVWAALSEVDRLRARTVAMPAISAGVFGYPPDDATRVIAVAAFDYLDSHPAGITELVLVGYDKAMADRFASALQGID